MPKNKKKDKQPEVKKETPKADDDFVMDGVVTESLRGKFRVEIQIEGGPKHEVLAHLAGKMKKNFIKIVPGDRVKVEVSEYDLTRGRITYRMKD